MRSQLLLAALVSLLSAGATHALESSLSVRSSLSAADLWSKIGDFCGMSAWDPAVERCDLSSDGKTRTIRFFGGIGSNVATLESWDETNRSFSWMNNTTLAPIANYRASVRVFSEGRTSVLNLTAKYDARGVSDAEAKQRIDDAIYRGLCLNSPFVCSADQGQLTPAETVDFDGLSLTSKPLKLRGYLRRSDTAVLPPAVVLLHGCGGFPEALDQNWGVKIAGWGYVTLTVDSFGPRGLKNLCDGSSPVSSMVFDPYQALKFLIEQKLADPKRVIVLGFSRGGFLGLSAVEEGPVEAGAANKFAAAAALYPVCRSVSGPMTVPTLILVGESDAWTPADACRKLISDEDDLRNNQLKGKGAPVRLVIYPNAYHAFDLPNFRVPITYYGHRHEYNKEATERASEALRDFFQSKIAQR